METAARQPASGHDHSHWTASHRAVADSDGHPRFQRPGWSERGWLLGSKEEQEEERWESESLQSQGDGGKHMRDTATHETRRRRDAER